MSEQQQQQQPERVQNQDNNNNSKINENNSKINENNKVNQNNEKLVKKQQEGNNNNNNNNDNDTDSDNEEGRIKNEVYLKMRKIHQRSQMPTQKSELIKYLSERIKQAQEALIDTQEILESQVAQRQRISKSIRQRNAQLQKLYQIDQKALPEKIKEKLTEVLTETITYKLRAQEQLQQTSQISYQYKCRYKQLKGDGKLVMQKLQEQTQRQEHLQSENIKINEENLVLENQMKDLQEQYNKIHQQKQNLELKYLQMKVSLERMNDIRAVLNRFFTNEDLFDEKMELKEQKVTLLHKKQSMNSSSMLPNKSIKNTMTKLKPINHPSISHNSNDDENFWKGDFSQPKNHY